MKVKKLALALSFGLLGAFSMFIINYFPQLSTMAFGIPHGELMRAMMEDVYPFYTHTSVLGSLLGIVFGFIDYFVFGIVLGALYNLFSKAKK